MNNLKDEEIDDQIYVQDLKNELEDIEERVQGDHLINRWLPE